MSARLENIGGRITEQKLEKPCLSRFQAFVSSEKSLNFRRKLLSSHWKNEDEWTEADGYSTGILPNERGTTQVFRKEIYEDQAFSVESFFTSLSGNLFEETVVSLLRIREPYTT